MTIGYKPSLKSLLLATALVAVSAPSSSLALGSDEVVLQSADGSIAVSGRLVEFTDEFYIIETTLGNLRVSAERVRCEGEACPVFVTDNADITITGSDVVGDGLMPLLMDGFSITNDAEAEITKTATRGEFLAQMVGDQGFGDEIGSYLVSATSSSSAFSQLVEQGADIAMSSRRIVPDEARALKKAGAGSMIRPDQEHLLAIDSVVVIVNPDNPVQQLTTEQLGQIYSGKITNWSEVGGPDQRIQVVGRQETSGTSASFYRFVFGEIDDWKFAPDIEVLESSNEVASFVNNQSNAIGFLGYAFQRGAKPVTIVNRCNMPMIPDSFSAKTGEYTLQSRLYLYNRADLEQDMAKDFLRYATSSEADVMITKAGFICGSPQPGWRKPAFD
jgi:phosphate transport system substrate-binding protein